ncbi:MAG: hypothetical protein MR598_06775 [Erysipelotrichaceae bacterium]|nr:hypothetical protein [Erysipelotrichaceae bacterium]
MKKGKFIVVMLCFLCLACGKKEEEDSIKFKEEYEKYNDQYIELEISDVNLIQYSNLEEINKIIKDGTGVIYIGSPTDDVSRRAVDVLLGVTHNTDLEKIYYISSMDGIQGIDSIEEKKIPLVLFVLDGEIVSYHIGTIEDKTDLSDDELVQLYNIYSEGVHKVLQDACDERC